MAAPRFPEFEPGQDGNVFRWIRQASERARSERRAAAIDRQRRLSDELQRQREVMRMADAQMEEREARELSERRARERAERKATAKVVPQK